MYDALIATINDSVEHGNPLSITVESEICNMSTIICPTNFDASDDKLVIYDDINGGVFEFKIETIDIDDDGEIEIFSPNTSDLVVISVAGC